MRRRQFLSVLGAAAAWPLAARAQQTNKPPTIGYLGTDANNWAAWTAAFVSRMRELGWIEGRTINIEYRWSEGRPERIAEAAAEFVRLNVDLIVSFGTAVPALRQRTSTIPIVFAIAVDPLGAGLIASLARPGANVTGLSIAQGDLAGKRLELLREVAPHLRRLAVMADITNSQVEAEFREVESMGRALGLEIVPFEIRRAEDIVARFEALKSRIDALYIVQDTLVVANRDQITMLALGARLPTIISARDFVQAGALMSYGPNYLTFFRRAAEYSDKILRGTKPSDLPVEQPTKFDLVINLKTAKTLGLAVPAPLLALADEVLE
jgi:putative ABC transport system substrate-binding protein